MDLFVVTSGGILVEGMSGPSTGISFRNSRISMNHPSKIICDQYQAGFTIDSLIDSLLVTIVIGHPREGKVNKETLIWSCVNLSGPITRGGLGHLILDASVVLIE